MGELVNCCAWAPSEYGLMLAAGSADGMISITFYNEKDFVVVCKLPKAHSEGVTSLSWGPVVYSYTESNELQENVAPQDLKLATGSCDQTVYIWTYKDSKLNLEGSWGHNDWVRDVSFAQNAGLPYELIASCSEDRTVKIFKKNNKGWIESKVIKFKVSVWKVSWSLVGDLLAIATADNFVYVYEEKEPDKWELISEIDPNTSNK